MYTVEENSNYPKGKGNLFLMRDGHCIGGADCELLGERKGQWRADIHTEYDPETDSDVRLLGWFATQDEARAALLAEVGA